MNKKIETIVHIFEEKYGNDCNFSLEKITEIVVNSLSLTNAWLNNEKSNSKTSYEIELYDKDGALSDTLHGITKDNLAETVADIIISKHFMYSKLVLNSFLFVNGRKISDVIGELDIS